MKDGPFLVIELRDHTLSLYINGIQNVLSMEMVNQAKTSQKIFFLNMSTSPSKPDEGSSRERRKLQPGGTGNGSSKEEVNKLFGDRQRNERAQFKVQRYKYAPAEDK